MTIKEYIGTAIYDPDGSMIWRYRGGDLGYMVDIRGWGEIRNIFPTEEAAADFQDQLGKFITDAINEKLNRLK